MVGGVHETEISMRMGTNVRTKRCPRGIGAATVHWS